MVPKLLLITSDFPPCYGGVARYYSGLFKQLGEEAWVLTSVKGGNEPQVVRRSWWWFGWPHWLPLLFLIPYYKIKTKAKYLAVGEILPIGTAVFLSYLAFGWKYVVFLHGLDITSAQKNWWKRQLVRWILAGASLVVTNSEFTKSLAIKNGAEKKQIAVIYPCSDIKYPVSQDLIESLKKDYDLSGKLVILSVCRLVERKGIDDVIKVLVSWQRVFPNLIYIVVGDGPKLESWKNLATDLGVKVIFAGFKNEAELAAWYSLSDVFILIPKNDPIDVEGFGTVYLEAQSASRPVIGSDVGGVQEAVGEAGKIVNDSWQLIQVGQDLLSNANLRRTLGRKGEERVRQQFNWPVQAKKLLKYLI